MGLASFASKPVQGALAANPKTFFQVYWIGTRDDVLRRLERARAAGAVGLIITVGFCFRGRPGRGSPYIPANLPPRELARFAPQGLRRPRWLASYARTRHLPDLTVPN